MSDAIKRLRLAVEEIESADNTCPVRALEQSNFDPCRKCGARSDETCKEVAARERDLISEVFELVRGRPYPMNGEDRQ